MWSSFRDKVLWSVGGGRSTGCVRDIWNPNLGTLGKFLLPGQFILDSATISEFVTSVGTWDVDLLKPFFSYSGGGVYSGFSSSQ